MRANSRRWAGFGSKCSRLASIYSRDEEYVGLAIPLELFVCLLAFQFDFHSGLSARFELPHELDTPDTLMAMLSSISSIS